jgi:EAL domain-containing protein (putative c-di-GMP-specific phosphodiesterase class I)
MISESQHAARPGALRRGAPLPRVPPPAAGHAPAVPDAEAEALLAGLDLDEVHAWFQPVHRLSDGAVVGAEAVARWARRGRGVLSHETVAQVADRAGLGGRVTERTVAQVLAFRVAVAAPRGFSMAVNLASADLRDAGIVERLHRRVEDFGLSPEHLALEVSEARLVEEARTAVCVLARLRQRGFGLAVDRFGSGWSSLALLAQVPFAELKLDARFVLAAPADRVAEAGVDASVYLGRRLGLAIGAEGVETGAHRVLCRRFGIGTAQGTVLGAAVSASDFAATWLRA